MRALLVVALLLAGCVGAPEPERREHALDPVRVAFDGALGLEAYACPIVLCVGGPIAGGQRFHRVELERDITRLDLVATWDPASPRTQRLVLGAFSCRDPCASDDDVGSFAFAGGPSPLRLDAPGFDLPSGSSLYVSMWIEGEEAGRFWAAASAPQPFHVDGTLS